MIGDSTISQVKIMKLVKDIQRLFMLELRSSISSLSSVSLSFVFNILFNTIDKLTPYFDESYFGL